jgi:hypothetical protein
MIWFHKRRKKPACAQREGFLTLEFRRDSIHYISLTSPYKKYTGISSIISENTNQDTGMQLPFKKGGFVLRPML